MNGSMIVILRGCRIEKKIRKKNRAMTDTASPHRTIPSAAL
jgi:hypothetical protein